MTLLRGTRVGPYEVLEPLGAGGMGEVYRARDPRLGRDVAMKVLPAAFSADPDRLARFKQEARAAGSLNHPNILTIHDIGLHEGAPYLVSELLEGETLKERLTSGPIPVRKAVEYALQMAEGLAAAHGKGIVHRDLKPANLFVTKDGRIKILDFGLAKLVQTEDGSTLINAPAKTESGVVMGTVGYMAPEQVRGQSTDHRSDIFAFGTVLYEMLSGQRAFHGQSAADIMSAILKEDPRALTALNKEVFANLERILGHCLEKDPAARFQSARDLAFDLQALSEVSGASTAPPARHRRSGIWPAVGVGAGVLVAIAAIWFGRSVRGPAPKPPASAVPAGGSAPPTATQSLPFTQHPDVASVAVLPFADMSAEKDQEYFSDGVSEELLNTLARIPGLRVTGRTSSFSFKGKNEDLRVIGQKLNVGAILEGSVRKSGRRVRITAQLVNAADGFHLWSESYDRTLDDIFAVQEDIARSVTAALKVTLLGEEVSGSAARVRNADAYNACLQAQFFHRRASKQDLERALGYYQQAIALDSAYAPAWAGLADAYTWMADQGFVPAETGYRQARETIQRALVLDANLANGFSVLGWIKRNYDWDWEGADAEIRRALALEPGNAEFVRRASGLSVTLGRFQESVELNRRAVELDPLSVWSWFNLGMYSWYAGRLGEAETACKKALEINPGNPQSHWALGNVYLTQGQLEAALTEMKQETHFGYRLQGLALAYHALGRKQAATEVLGELIQKGQYVGAFQIAEAYSFWGEADRAFAWLERAYTQRDVGLSYMVGDPLLKNLERDPRYVAFLRKMRLPL